LKVFFRSRRHQRCGEELAESRIVRAPALPDERLHRSEALAGLGCQILTLVLSDRKAAVQDQMRNALGMPHRIGNRYGAALGKADEGETAKGGGVGYRLHVANLYNVNDRLRA
jgi:hypothetical protein